MNWINLKGAAVLTMLLSGCASSIDLEQTLSDYHSAKVCCASPSEFNFQGVSKHGTTEVSITRDSPAFLFADGGKSYFAAFNLPLGANVLLVRSKLIVGNPIVSMRNYYFYPLVTFFDEQKALIKTSTIDQLVYRPTGIKNSFIELSEPVPPNAKFFVIHTSEQLLDGHVSFSLKYDRSVSVNGVYAGNISGERPLPASPFSPNGGIELEIQ